MSAASDAVAMLRYFAGLCKPGALQDTAFRRAAALELEMRESESILRIRDGLQPGICKRCDRPALPRTGRRGHPPEHCELHARIDSRRTIPAQFSDSEG